MDAPQAVVLAVLGLSIGSFLNVVIHRLPLKQSIANPPSRCPGCGSTLRWYDNIPVASWMMLGGRCRACRAPISMRYPVVEILTMALFLLHGWIFGWTPLLGVRLLLACALVALFAIDLEHHLLPDAITLPGIVAGLAASLVLPPGVRDALIGALAGGGVLWLVGEAYFRVAGREGMGGGDVKMLAMIGAFLGWKPMVLTLMLSSVAGSVIGAIIIAARRGGMKYELPYGTFLALGALAASLVGDDVIAWYVGLYR